MRALNKELLLFLKCVVAFHVAGIAIVAVFYAGYTCHRAMFYYECRDKWDAKGGAPILLYPPDGMYDKKLKYKYYGDK